MDLFNIISMFSVDTKILKVKITLGWDGDSLKILGLLKLTDGTFAARSFFILSNDASSARLDTTIPFKAVLPSWKL